MKAMKILGWTMLLTVVLVALAASAAVAWIGSLGSFADTVIQFDDTTLTLPQFGPAEWIATVGGLGIALVATAFVVFVVVPLAVLLPLALVALLLVGMAGGVALGVAGLVTLLCSPLLLFVGFVWLVWRLCRGRPAPRGSAGPEVGATIAR